MTRKPTEKNRQKTAKPRRGRPFEKGNTANLSGRPPGTPNKVGRLAKEAIADLVNNNFEAYAALVLETLANEALEPLDRLRPFENAMKFVLPTKIEAKGDLGITALIAQVLTPERMRQVDLFVEENKKRLEGDK